MNTEAPARQSAPVTHSEAGSATIAELVSEWLSTRASRAGALARLALAEARLAAVSVALMTFLAMLAAIFAFTAWGLGVAALVSSLLAAGLELSAILIAIAALHVLIAFVLWNISMRLGKHVEFHATRQQLREAREDVQ